MEMCKCKKFRVLRRQISPNLRQFGICALSVALRFEMTNKYLRLSDRTSGRSPLAFGYPEFMATAVAGLGAFTTLRVARSTRSLRGGVHRRPAGLHGREPTWSRHGRTAPVARLPRGSSPTVHRARSSTRGSAIVTRAAAEGVPEPKGVALSEDTWKTLRVSSFIFFWYFLNAIFAIINKRTLSVFPYPWLLSWVQIAVGAAFMLVMWRLRVFKPPSNVGFDAESWKALWPTSCLHLVAHVTACASYSLGSVSFMQVVKAGEPACSVILLTLFFGRKYSKLVWLTLIPIVGGVAVGSTTELNFSMASFVCAMISNVASALRSVTSKDLQDATGLRGINLYGAMSVVGAVVLLPISLVVEGAKLPAAFAAAPAGMAAKGITLFGATVPFLAYLFVGSMLFHLYNQTSYQALGELSPLDISVANAVKRVVIILASVAVFRNPITPLGAWAGAVAILGTFLYSLAAQKQAADAADAAAAAKSA